MNVIKHSHHSIQLEPAHKDSARFRHAGAGRGADCVAVPLCDRARIARRTGAAARGTRQPDSRPADLILVEGFTREFLPRLEIVRPALARDPLYQTDAAILAIASDDPAALSTSLVVLHLDDIDSIGEFICKTVRLNLKMPLPAR